MLNIPIVSVQCPVLVIDSIHNLSQELGCRGHITIEKTRDCNECFGVVISMMIVVMMMIHLNYFDSHEQ